MPLLTRSLFVTFIGLALAASSAVPAEAHAPSRQDAYAAAAREFGVPEDVLLGVSYLQSRWDVNAGRPSVVAGYGPMHLTDARAAVAESAQHHDHEGEAPHELTEDPRGDASRPFRAPETDPAKIGGPSLQTADLAGRVTGTPKERLKSDPAENIRGGAALLAHYQRSLGITGSSSGDWYAAVARYGRSTTRESAGRFADEVYETINEGASRTTDDGQRVTLRPAAVRPDTRLLDRLRLPAQEDDAETECPRTLECEWVPAPYEKTGDGPGDYGNHDKADRPRSQKIRYIVIHDMEGYYEPSLRLVQDPTYVSWQYSLRAADGHVAQHLKAKDVAWQAGNWYINAKSVGLEHEGFLADPGTWYTEAMYRSSAELVRYLTRKHRIPRDRAHIIGHDNVPGITPRHIPGMHTDPGPYWDWAHYFELLGAPLRGRGPARRPGSVMIKPDLAANKVPYTGCDKDDPAKPCPERGSASVMLRTAPDDDAPLVRDPGKNPGGGESTMDVYDHSARASTGQIYAVAGRRGGWTAIWYLGQKAWLPARYTVPATGFVVTPKKGRDTVPVYGRAYPEAAAYPDGVEPQPLVPLPYEFAAGQRYALGLVASSEYYHAKVFDQSTHTVVRGRQRYYQIQFGHRVAFVKTGDVVVRPARMAR